MRELNNRQKKIRDSWPQLLWVFTKREWLSLFLSSSFGVLAAESVHLVLQDRSFQASAATHYKPWVAFDDPRYYVPYLAVFLLVLLLAFGPPSLLNIWRGLRSWVTGVTSGLVLLPFASAFWISIVPAPSARPAMYGDSPQKRCTKTRTFCHSSLGIDFISLHEGVDTSTPNGRLVFGIFASIDQE